MKFEHGSNLGSSNSVLCTCKLIRSMHRKYARKINVETLQIEHFRMSLMIFEHILSSHFSLSLLAFHFLIVGCDVRKIVKVRTPFAGKRDIRKLCFKPRALLQQPVPRLKWHSGDGGCTCINNSVDYVISDLKMVTPLLFQTRNIGNCRLPMLKYLHQSLNG